MRYQTSYDLSSCFKTREIIQEKIEGLIYGGRDLPGIAGA
jgi:hypothetical protein